MRINVGFDDNFNAALDSEEVDTFTDVCETALTMNSYTVKTDGSASVLDLLSAVSGVMDIVSIDDDLVEINNNTIQYIGTLEIGDFDSWNTSSLEAVYFTNLSYIGNLKIRYCRDLQTLNLGSIDSIRDLFIQVNDSIENLNAISSISGDLNVLSISANLELQDISGLSGITSTNGLVIDNNDSLAALNGLNNITEVTGGNLYIGGNAILTDISALGNIGSVSGNVVIENNPMLATCAAEAIVASIGVVNISGAVTISGNDDAGVCE